MSKKEKTKKEIEADAIKFGIYLGKLTRKKRHDNKQVELKPIRTRTKRTRIEKEMSTHMKRREMLERYGKTPTKSVKRPRSEIDYYWACMDLF